MIDRCRTLTLSVPFLFALVLPGLAGPATAAADGQQTLKVENPTPGGGTVASSPAGLSCEVGGFFCGADFPPGTAAVLTGSPNKGFAFSGFEGACYGPACALTMDSDKTVSVDFVRFAPIGKVRRNEENGSAVLVVRVGGPGELIMIGRRVKRQVRALAADANVKVPIIASGSAPGQLQRRGWVKVSVKVYFTPTAGTRASFSRSLWLYRETVPRKQEPELLGPATGPPEAAFR